MKLTIGFRDQTDAVAKCCDSTFNRYSGERWFSSHPWVVQMPHHAATCDCGKVLNYEEVAA